MYQKEGLAAAEELLAPYRREEAGEQALNDRELNRLGYRLLARGHVDQAIDILRLNARLFPDVANVWDSLAEATAESGDAETAIELYRKALEVDPDFESAKRGLERLETDDR